MTYDGALVMPRNCVAMQEDEMTYVEGGGVATWIVGGAIDAAIVVFAGWVYGSQKAIAALIRNNISKIKSLVTSAIKKLFSPTASQLNKIGIAINAVIAFAGLSVGGCIADALDRADGKYNGYIF